MKNCATCVYEPSYMGQNQTGFCTYNINSLPDCVAKFPIMYCEHLHAAYVITANGNAVLIKHCPTYQAKESS